MTGNVLYYGDNLDILRRYVKDESVDLIYLDPPFKSNQDYNILFAEKNGSGSASQIKAFEDTWHWNLAASRAFQEVIEASGRVAETMIAFRKFIGDNDMLAYLSMMAPRLAELRRVLKSTGSIYLHCDPTASHYLKMLMDAVFGIKNFQNEIAWHYSGWNAKLNSSFNSRHDILLYYSKNMPNFNSYSLPWISEEEYVKVRKQKVHVDENNCKYVLSDAGRGKRVKRFLEDAMKYGKPVDDVWSIDKINNSSNEYLGYPTQKPEALLERIIQASSNEGDMVLDPFCGCGTAIHVAQRLKRNWIGIDITCLATTLIKNRLHDAFGEDVKYEVVGEPVSLPDARALAIQDPFQFQYWALGLVHARPAEQRRGADKGIDGKYYFDSSWNPNSKTGQIVFSVKTGQHVGVAHIRDLGHVVSREEAEIGVLITLHEPTKPMREEAAGAGFYESPWGKHPRLQIRTVAELMEGKGIDCPPQRQTNVTFKKAPKAKGSKSARDQNSFGL